MKVCETCGIQISTQDGENRCRECEEVKSQERQIQIKQSEANLRRHEREQAMRDLGLTKVRGSLGGTYWE